MKHPPLHREPKGRVGMLLGEPRDVDSYLSSDVGLHNVYGYQRAFNVEPRVMDFLNPASPFYSLKKLSARLYFDCYGTALSTLPPTARVLDVACGVGRFTVPLAQRFAQVTAFDACPSAVDACEQHVQEAGLTNVELAWADLTWLDDLPAESFDLICAIEALCYTAEAPAAVQRLARVAKPGALMLAAVEAQPGALCGQAMEPGELAAVLNGAPLFLRHDRWVRYYDRAALTELLTGCGWRLDNIVGSHFVSEGPFWQAMDDRRLEDAEYVERIIEVERLCREHPLTRDLARVLCATARKG